jgi:NAD(P)H dehydrogenase (quinone)
MRLRILILYANPVASSFGAALHSEVVTALRSRGHEIDDCDLYAERFDPVLSEQERIQYHDIKLNRAHIAAYADRLLAAEALILVYPVWNEGFPAILKGFFDRVFIPGVSFTVGPGSGHFQPRAVQRRWQGFAPQIGQVAQPPRLGLGLAARAFPRPFYLAADGIGRRPSCSPRGRVAHPPRPPFVPREMRARGSQSVVARSARRLARHKRSSS